MSATKQWCPAIVSMESEVTLVTTVRKFNCSVLKYFVQPFITFTWELIKLRCKRASFFYI
jgi:hypothetical protein